MTTPVRVAVTGAAGQIAYNLLFSIANGDMLGPDQPVALQLLEIPPAMDALGGVALELEDCAFPLLTDMVTTSDPQEAFTDVNWALLVGSKPRGKGMERGDLIRENGPIFVSQGGALESSAAADVRVLVVGNPCNTNCLIAMEKRPLQSEGPVVRDDSAGPQPGHRPAGVAIEPGGGRRDADDDLGEPQHHPVSRFHACAHRRQVGRGGHR